MKTGKVALLGANGQLGQTLLQAWVTGETTRNLALQCLDLPEFDLTNTGQVQQILDQEKFDFIINAAAYTQVDQAEKDSDAAFAINQTGVETLARWVVENNAHLVHISTDYVFDGNASRPYLPQDIPSPVNVYGRSKLAGEEAIKAIAPECVTIVRTSWLYSPHGSNFVKSMLRHMASREQLSVVADQLGTPTSTASLAELIISIVSGDTKSGVYHWTDAGAASWYDFAIAIQEEALAAGLLDRKASIIPVRSEDYPTAAKRPSYSVLDKTDTYKSFNLKPVHWREKLRAVLKEIGSLPRVIQ